MPHCEAKLGVRGIAVLSEERIRNTQKLSFKRQEAKENFFLKLTHDGSNFHKISSKWTNIHTHHIPQTLSGDIWK